MRAALLACLLLVAIGCGKSTSTSGTHKPTEPNPSPKGDTPKAKAVPETPPNFDPNSLETTLRWMAWELNASRTTPEGNHAAAEEAGKNYVAKINRALKSKPIKWTIPAVEVISTIDAPVGINTGLESIEYAGNGPTRRYNARLCYRLTNLFVLPVKDTAWGKTIAKGEKVVLRGTVHRVAFNPDLLPHDFWADPKKAYEQFEFYIHFADVDFSPLPK